MNNYKRHFECIIIVIIIIDIIIRNTKKLLQIRLSSHSKTDRNHWFRNEGTIHQVSALNCSNEVSYLPSMNFFNAETHICTSLVNDNP